MSLKLLHLLFFRPLAVPRTASERRKQHLVPFSKVMKRAYKLQFIHTKMHRARKLCALFLYMDLFCSGYAELEISKGEAATRMDTAEFVVCESAVFKVLGYIYLT